ncbi:TetR/AcrR family transcriptional regulator [Streptomyces sp. NPDC048057]|uniref:TetR/AcrR family transcriptional regulator n=1 Tax=Streptomyces sp. NPDC048057 TaxID=3155628 RepID=UPI0033FCC97F
MAEAPEASRRRKLTPEREQELLRVTAELVGEVGYDHVTMAEVARRAKCSTATLYRQWESKPRLVVAAWKAHGQEQLAAFAEIDTGDLRGDLAAYVHLLVTGDPDRETFASLPPAIMQDQDLMELVRKVLLHPVVDGLTGLLERAAARGEIVAGHPVIALADRLVFGPWFAIDVLYGSPATEKQLMDVIDTVLLPALAAVPAVE